MSFIKDNWIPLTITAAVFVVAGIAVYNHKSVSSPTSGAGTPNPNVQGFATYNIGGVKRSGIMTGCGEVFNGVPVTYGTFCEGGNSSNCGSVLCRTVALVPNSL